MKILDISTKIASAVNYRNSKKFSKYPKFNPSIVHLEDNKYAVVYRIWKSDYTSKNGGYPGPWKKGSPWEPVDDMWSGTNEMGLSIIEINDSFTKLKILFTQVLDINANWFNYGGEDARIFTDSKNQVKIIYGMIRYKTQRLSRPNTKKTYKVYESFLLYKSKLANSKADLLKLVKTQKPITKTSLRPVCIQNTYPTEKNWMPFHIKNRDYILYMSYPETFPTYIFSQINNKCGANPVFTTKSQSIIKTLKKVFPDIYVTEGGKNNNDIVFKVNKKQGIVGRWNSNNEPVFKYKGTEYIDNYPFSSLEKNRYSQMIRVGGGGPLVDYSGNELIGVAHIVFDCSLIHYAYTNGLFDLGNSGIPKKEIPRMKQIVKNLASRPIILPNRHSNKKYINHHLTLSYYVVLFTVNKRNPSKITKMSSLYSFGSNNEFSGLNFPESIIRSNQDKKWIIATGNADNRSLLVEVSDSWIKNALIPVKDYNWSNIHLCDVKVPSGKCRKI